MDDELRKVQLSAGWVLTGCGLVMIVVNAMQAKWLLCLALGVSLLAFAKAGPRKL